MKHILGFCLLLGTTCVLADNLDNFKSIIEIVNSLNTTWKANPDMPDDLTISSFERLLGELLSGRKMESRGRIGLPDMDIPEEFDARTEWPDCPTISQIRDQGSCGSCWAVAAASVFSDRLCIASGGNLTAPLSSEELMACCDYCGDGCNGGHSNVAWKYFANTGLVTGGEYQTGIGCQPYSVKACDHAGFGPRLPCFLFKEDTPVCQHECTNTEYETPYEEDHHTVESAYLIVGEEEIQKEIMTYGPVSASFTVYSDFPTYKSGVYKQTTGTLVGGHSVRLLGWGSEGDTPYWLVANSWNADWGDEGLFKILRGSDECSIESAVTAGIPSL